MVVILGMEGSANKIGIGVIRDGDVLSNPRKTYITPPGQGFKPTETAKHHQTHAVQLTRQALNEAGVKPEDVDAIAYTMVGYFFCFLPSLSGARALISGSK